MKLIDNVTRPVGHPIGMYLEMIGKRKMHILVASSILIWFLFLVASCFVRCGCSFFLAGLGIGTGAL